MRVVFVSVDQSLPSLLVPSGAEILVIPSWTSFLQSKGMIETFGPDFIVCGSQVLPQLPQNPNRQPTAYEEAEALKSKMSPRHRDILRLLHCGLQNREIAAQLGLSARTVKAYMSQLFVLFDVTNRTELVARVGDLRILEVPTARVA